MFKKFTHGCVIIMQKFLPDPFIFAVILTFMVFALGMLVTVQSPMDMIIHWQNGFWNLLAFSMQMALILVTGHTLANAPLFKKGLSNMAQIAKTPTQATVAVTFVSIIACWINWGFGLVIGALYAKELAREVKNVDYRLLIASAYSGFLVWHGGISGSIPLKLATGGEDLIIATNHSVTEAIATSETVFSTFNLVIAGILLFTLPLINRAMHPAEDRVVTVDPKLFERENKEEGMVRHPTPADKLENSSVISYLAGSMGMVYVIYYFYSTGFKLNLNIVNFMFLFLGIIFHRTPRKFLDAVSTAVKGTAGIMIQFPFYAGIMGMMVGQNADGLSFAGVICQGFVGISNQVTFPLFTFLSAGIVNFFVPSGGGQWAVQAPVVMPAGAALGVPAAKTAMSIAWGDAWTNMIQPFWALPALGIARLEARDIMGFCVIDLLYSGVVIALILMFIS
ncbi:MAG: short-chain fatty acid transporter [Deltaproteobacteria bacterium]|nr:short-chain fatty acid transporter [Deltaproteobacteria bacterium]